MISKISKKIAENLIRKNVILLDDYDLYHYGLFVLLSEAFLFSCCFVIGAILKIILPTILFYFVFFVLHRFSGGVHVKTELHCQMITLTFFSVSIIAIKQMIDVNDAVLLTIYLLCAVVLIILSPSDTPQKPLIKKERVLFKKITTLILAGVLVLLLVFNMMESNLYTNSIIVAVILQTISVICGRLFNKRLLSINT